jgi:hypothetical protein
VSKPTIFFSHSSLDKAQLSRLKDRFCAKTGGAIEVFLSCDGQSIPLGTNWVYRIQESLDATALMVVFITPNSLKSRWIYFESGYSYAKGVRVIPVGFLGVDVGNIGPPLSLLQAFNITSSETLNNLIALTNERFGHNHSLSFSPSDYDYILGSEESTKAGPFSGILEYIDDIHLYLTKNECLRAEPGQLLSDINALLDVATIEHQSSASSIQFRGVTISAIDGIVPNPLQIDAAPATLHITLPTIINILSLVRGDGVKNVAFSFELTDGMGVLQKTHKLTAQLYDSEIQLGPEGGLVFRDLKFNTGNYSFISRSSPRRGNAYVRMIPLTSVFGAEDAAALLKLLLASGVIFREETSFS